MIEKINNEVKKLQLQGLPDARILDIIVRRMYPLLPGSPGELFALFNDMLALRKVHFLWLVTMWIKKRRELYELAYMPRYESWLNDYIDRWGTCDIFCYRVLNPMVEKYPGLFENVMRWTESSKTYVRRASPVSLLQSGRGFTVNCEIDKVFTVAGKLKDDREVHVQKGVGWLLKYAYLSYPDEVYRYLKNNVENLPRVVFRYAIEKTPPRVREELIKL